MGSDSDCDYDYHKFSYGRLELIIGNMFSGKSTELIRRINREKSINKKIIVINYSGDNRYSTNSVATHDQTKVNSLKLTKLSEFNKNMINQYDSFFIDEGQFFSDLYDFTVNLVDKHKKHVVISGLDGDSNRNTFGDLIKLIPICDTIDKLHAYCNKCNNGTVAPFTKRILNNSTEVVDIGGSNKYIPVCRFHYLL
jgi:thymidine kinase